MSRQQRDEWQKQREEWRNRPRCGKCRHTAHTGKCGWLLTVATTTSTPPEQVTCECVA